MSKGDRELQTSLPKRLIFQVEELTISEAVNRVPFTVLLPTELPWPERRIQRILVQFFRPLVPGYFAKLDIIYWCKGMPGLYVGQSDTSPRIDPTVGCDFSDSDLIEKLGCVVAIVSPIGERRGGYYATFQRAGTHVVIYSSNLSREQLASFAASFEPAEPKL